MHGDIHNSHTQLIAHYARLQDDLVIQVTPTSCCHTHTHTKEFCLRRLIILVVDARADDYG